jgi:hypothetical protein
MSAQVHEQHRWNWAVSVGAPPPAMGKIVPQADIGRLFFKAAHASKSDEVGTHCPVPCL